jgi:hypothetical protein
MLTPAEATFTPDDTMIAAYLRQRNSSMKQAIGLGD